MDDDRINQEKHNCKSEKKGIKLFVLSLVLLIFLPITAFAVLDWFASSDALAIGITGYIQTVIAVSYTHLDVYKRPEWDNTLRHCK